VKRREFITLLGGAAAAWPLGARAQQPPGNGKRRIGVLVNYPEEDFEGQARVAAFRKSLTDFGWVEGNNLQLELRWSPGEVELTRNYVEELLGLSLDVIMTSSNAAVVALRRLTETQPVVFTIAADPVQSGFVSSLARPGGNMTGFTQFESDMGGKWLEILHEVAPDVKRALVLVSRENTISRVMERAIQDASPRLGISVASAGEVDAAGFERALHEFAREPYGGVIVPPNAPAIAHRNLIVRLAAELKLPTIYSGSGFVAAGGLISYGIDAVDTFRQAASYVDRILRGEKPGDLPVQAPTRFVMAVNVKTARMLGTEIPKSILLRADEVME
jgi:putative ABC transport system substrate-binding protein